ncbi:MAG: hypothetical protein ABIF06_01735 [bacterium]
MTKVVFITKAGVGLDTEELMREFFEKNLKWRLLELLKVILYQEFSVISVETRKSGPYDPSPKIIINLDGEINEVALKFVECWLRIEHPDCLKELL